MSVIFDVWLFNMEQAVCFVARGSYLLHSHWCVCLCLVRSPLGRVASQGVLSVPSGALPSQGVTPLGEYSLWGGLAH